MAKGVASGLVLSPRSTTVGPQDREKPSSNGANGREQTRNPAGPFAGISHESSGKPQPDHSRPVAETTAGYISEGRLWRETLDELFDRAVPPIREAP